jgi:nucleoside-diphosphate-sugar epimerase
MRVCVTGAGGFLGSALVRRLRKEGIDLLAIARSPPRSTVVSAATQWVVRDLSHSHKPFGGLGRIDAVIHLAGRAHVLQEVSSDPLAAFRWTNVEMSTRIAHAAANAGASRFIFVSSIAVYGRSLTGPEVITEASLTDPADPYATSKWEAEEALRRIAQERGLDLIVVRPALIVGSDAPGNLRRLASLVARGWPLPVPARANARAFVALNNILELLVLCLRHPAAADETFVAADPESPSTRQAIEWIAEGMGCRVRTFPIPARLLRVMAASVNRASLYDKMFGDLWVNANKARSMLGWKPVESLSDAFRAVGRSHGWRRDDQIT